MNTPFGNKCEIIYSTWSAYSDEAVENNYEGWVNFFDWADAGIPLAGAIANNLCLPTESGTQIIEDTWKELCKIIRVDPNAKYNNLVDFFASSPNKTITKPEEG